MPRPSLREELLAAGLEVLHQKGFNATSVQDITDAAGAPKGSFYNHFESKEALAAEALREYVERGKARREILRDATVPPLRRLRKYFETLVEAAVDAGFSAGCLLGNFAAEMSPQSTLIRKRVGEALAAWSGVIAGVIREAQESGAITAVESPKVLAAFVIDAWEGAMLRAKVAKDRAPLDAFLQVTFTRLLP
jgi:TetR/AcrR family transcriptional repressor of nem operon